MGAGVIGSRAERPDCGCVGSLTLDLFGMHAEDFLLGGQATDFGRSGLEFYGNRGSRKLAGFGAGDARAFRPFPESFWFTAFGTSRYRGPSQPIRRGEGRSSEAP